MIIVPQFPTLLRVANTVLNTAQKVGDPFPTPETATYSSDKHSFEDTNLGYDTERAKVTAYQNYFSVESEY